VSIVLVALPGPPGALAQPRSGPTAPAPAAVTPPIDLNDVKAIEAGKEHFQVTCTHYCHGAGGRGGGIRGPSLRNRHFDNAYLFARISNGFPPMPAFKEIYTPEQIWNIIAYIQSLKD
jgi:mono/diheme cytochrome c family protein